MVIDQGTTSTRAIVFDAFGQKLGSAAKELTQYFPKPGWVEHSPEEIWAHVGLLIPQALERAGLQPKQLAGLGVTNQRETVVLWEKTSGKTLSQAIVWQDRRTADFCHSRRSDEDWIRKKTGLVLDPYFSATKLAWILEQNASLKNQAENGHISAGTIDSFLINRLTGGLHHKTDRTNASRTLLANLKDARWDDDLLDYFGIPEAVLPEIQASSSWFGTTKGLSFLPDGIPILGVAGDQQAALFGQGAFDPGDAKCTYGTGAFFLQHLGSNPTISSHQLLTTIAAGCDQSLEYALEGAVFVAGAAVQWLRDGLKLIENAPAIEKLASMSEVNEPILFVPGFVGLGAPHWIPEAHGALFGLTRSTTGADLGRATLEGVAFQVADLIEAAAADAGKRIEALWVDGGMATNSHFLQTQANILGMPVIQASTSEATARGAAFLAGLTAGIWSTKEDLRKLLGECRSFYPQWDSEQRSHRIEYWRKAVRALISFYRGSTLT